MMILASGCGYFGVIRDSPYHGVREILKNKYEALRWNKEISEIAVDSKKDMRRLPSERSGHDGTASRRPVTNDL